MKYFITLISLILLPLCVKAQNTDSPMKVVEGSFINSNAKSQKAGGSNIGGQDMTAMSITWPVDADGKDEVALLIVEFQNFPPAEIQSVTPTLSGGQLVVQKDVRQAENGNHYMMVFLPAGKNTDVTFTHPRYGSTRLSGKDFVTKQVYYVTLRNDKLLPIYVTSNPTGAKVILDGNAVGKTPYTGQEITMGSHLLSLETPNAQIADGLVEQTIEVVDGANNFDFDLRKEKEVEFIASPSSATIQIFKNGSPVTSPVQGRYRGKLKMDEYTVRGTLETSGLTVNDTYAINDNLTMPITVRVVPRRAITFKAIRNNEPVEAYVTIDGESYGKTTPCDKELEYGSYKVTMTHEGVGKTKTLKVNKKTKSICELRLPNRQSRHYNPFNIDYQQREWGINVSYISKSYSLKVNGHSKNYDLWGQEKNMNGVQAGITYQPYFGAGQGLNTGVFWQGFFGTVDDLSDANYKEHSIYVPLQYQFRLPLAKNFSVALNAGAAMTLGVYNVLEVNGETIDIGYGDNNESGVLMPKSFQMSLPFGVALQYKSLQLDFKYSVGLTNNEHLIDAESGVIATMKANMWTAGLSLLF